MIITCEKCSTKYNFDETLLEENGSKVRCSQCKHVFTVFPAPQPEQTEEIEETGDEFESYFDREEGVSADVDFDMEEVDLELGDDDDDAYETDEDEFDMDEDEFDVDEDEFDLDEDEFEGDEEEFEADESELTLDENELTLDEEELSLDEEDLGTDTDEPETSRIDELAAEEEYEEPEAEEIDQLSMEEAGDTEDGAEAAFEFELDVDSGEGTEGVEALPDGEEEEESLSDLDVLDLGDDESGAPAGGRDEDAGEAYDLSRYDDVLGAGTAEEDIPELLEPEESGLEAEDSGIELFGLEKDEGPGEGDAETREINISDISEDDFEPAGAEESKKKPAVGKPVLILLILAILLLIGYGSSVVMGVNIYELSKTDIPLIGKFFESPAAEKNNVRATLSNESVNGRFVNNEQAGKIFVITGEVTNTSGSPLSHIQVAGSLVTKGDQVAKTKNAFCGNLISETQLKNADMKEINSMLARKKGKNNTNVNVKPQRSVPFMIVFSDLPENLDNFTVKVAKYDRL